MWELLKDLWLFMRERKKYWLAPIVLVMVLLGGLIFLAQGFAVAPFIYTLFWRGTARVSNDTRAGIGRNQFVYRTQNTSAWG